MTFGLFATLLAVATPVEVEGCMVGRVFFEAGSTRIIAAQHPRLEDLYGNVARMLTPNAWIVLEAAPEGDGQAAMHLARSRVEEVRRGLADHPVHANPVHTRMRDSIGDIEEYVRRSVAVLVYMPRVEWRRRYGNVLC